MFCVICEKDEDCSCLPTFSLVEAAEFLDMTRNQLAKYYENGVGIGWYKNNTGVQIPIEWVRYRKACQVFCSDIIDGEPKIALFQTHTTGKRAMEEYCVYKRIPYIVYNRKMYNFSHHKAKADTLFLFNQKDTELFTKETLDSYNNIMFFSDLTLKDITPSGIRDYEKQNELLLKENADLKFKLESILQRTTDESAFIEILKENYLLNKKY